MLGDLGFNNAQLHDDNELCRLCRAGDESAFRVIASRYYLMLKKYASRFAVNGIDSDDLFQEGLIALHNAAMTYDENADAADHEKKECGCRLYRGRARDTVRA